MAFVLVAFTGSAEATHFHTQPVFCFQRVAAKQFAPFSHRVWKLERWRRGAPKARTIAAYHHKLSCAAGPRNRQAMQERWHREQGAYFAHRHKMRWLAKFKPYVYPDGTRWAVPWPIAACESGENYFVGPSGAYGLIPPFPQWMPPRRQDEVAHRLYEQLGESPWAPYEGGCAYR